jgi:hypothetical protein
MNLSGGVYTITITDHNGCTIIRSFFISQPSPMDVHIDSLNALCPDSCDGEITSAITGGTPFSSGNYHYIWSNGQTTENIDNLCPGIYDLTVTDSMGCVIVKSITVSVKINAYFIIYPDSTTPHHYYIANASTGFPSIISYFWSWGDGTYDTIAYPSHTYSAAGNYKICLTVSNGMCTSTYCDSSYLSKSPNSIISVTVIPGTTGISVNELADRINVYPNPTTGNLQIQTSMQIKNIEITDITGRLLYTTSVKTIDCSNFARGVYFIRATTEKGIAVKKFIKE